MEGETMAKAIGPLHSELAYGSIRNAFTYRRWKNMVLITKYDVPKQRLTEWQKKIRGIGHIVRKMRGDR
jgi:hypothetical protein